MEIGKTFKYQGQAQTAGGGGQHAWSKLPGYTDQINLLTGHNIPKVLDRPYQKRKGVVFPALPFIPWVIKYEST